MIKMMAAVSVAFLAAGVDAAAVLVPRRGGGSSIQNNEPLKWQQILGVAIGCAVWVVLWIFGMTWLIRRNRRKRAEIDKMKTDLERDHPGMLTKAGISPPSHDPEKAPGVLRQLLCPCLSCLPCGSRRRPASPTSPGPPSRDEHMIPPEGPSIVKPPPVATEEKVTLYEPSEKAPVIVLPKTPPVRAETPKEQPKSSLSATLPRPIPTTEDKTITGAVDIDDRTLTGHNGRIGSLAFSHDSRLVASASNDNTIKLWDTTTDQCQQTLTGHSGWVRSVVFSHDSKLLVSGSEDGTVKVWSTEGGECRRTLRDDDMKRVYSVAFSYDSELIASASSDGHIRVWETATGERKQKLLRTPVKEAWAVAFSHDPHDSQLLVSAYSNGNIEHWDAATGKWRQTNGIYDVDELSSSSFAGLGDWPRDSRYLDGLPGSTWSVAFSHNLGMMVSAPPNETTAELYDTFEQCMSLQYFKGRGDNPICSVAMSRDSKFVATGSKDCTVSLWDAETGDLLRTLKGHGDWVSAVAFSRDSGMLASGSGDCTVRLWDIAKK